VAANPSNLLQFINIIRKRAKDLQEVIKKFFAATRA
jgi:hypothetical protein